MPESSDATIILAMDELRTEAKRNIIRLLFPDLRYGGDPDIERYFESRKEGRVAQALSLYNGALRVRYPDDASRIELLRLYRESDPRYSSYQEKLLLDFAEGLALRIRGNIDLITAPLERADLSDALRALKAVESILSRLPGEAEGAPDVLGRYYEFARALDYRKELAQRALELVREYDAVSRADAPADYDFVARSAAIEERRRSAAGGRSAAGRAEEGYDFVARSAEIAERRREERKGGTNYFDPSRIKFTEADRSRVEISSALSRREDKVLAFCAKYWPRARDLAFERMVFLYSRKFGGRHFEIFRAIKLGRARGASDDEMLSAVSGILTTSYNYSVSGDLYMQVMWRRIRARMEAEALAERLAAPGPESRVRSRREAFAAVSAPKDEGPDLPPVPPPPAGDEAPTRFARRPGEHAAPPAFALKEASERARAESAARDAEPARSARAASEESGLGLRVARRSPESPARRTIPASPIERRTPGPKPEALADSLEPRTRRALSEARAAADARAEPVAPEALKRAIKAEAPKAPSSLPKRKAKGRSALASDAARIEPSLRPLAGARRTSPLMKRPAAPEPVKEIKAKRSSISDEIRKLSGKPYDVYKVIFLEKVRDDIRKILLASQTRSHGLFGTAANDAENQVYGFIAEHYDDPFMDWEHSAERELVESLGFSLPSLAPVIAACFKRL